MTEEFEYKGKWWITNNPEKEFYGTLKFIPNRGIFLELNDFKFEDIKNKFLNFETILGVSSDAKKITLYECWESHFRESVEDDIASSVSYFYVSVAFVGAHFQRKEDIKFKNLSIRYSHLDNWVNISGFKSPLNQSNNYKEFTVKYNYLEPIQVNISKDNENYKLFINIAPAQSIPISIPGICVGRKLTIEERVFINIEPSEEKSFDEYLNIIYLIQIFLSLGVGETVYPLSIKGIFGENKLVEVFYIALKFPMVSKISHPLEMFFTFQDVSNELETLLNKWFKESDSLKYIYDIYFGVSANPYMYIENKFLSLVQAIESFHRHKYGGKYLPDEEYKKLYDALIKAIPEDTKDDLKQRLKGYLEYGNEFSLRKRLKEIFDEFRDVLSEFIRDYDEFIDKVVNLRNHLVHYDKTLKEYPINKDELYFITKKLKLLLEICLLRGMGLSLEKIRNLILRNWRIKNEY